MVKATTKKAKTAKKATAKKTIAQKKTTRKKTASSKKTTKKAVTAKKAGTKKSAPKSSTARKRRISKPSLVDDHMRFKMIAEAAYLLAEKRGFCGGDQDEDWYQAEREVNERLMSGC